MRERSTTHADTKAGPGHLPHTHAAVVPFFCRLRATAPARTRATARSQRPSSSTCRRQVRPPCCRPHRFFSFASETMMSLAAIPSCCAPSSLNSPTHPATARTPLSSARSRRRASAAFSGHVRERLGREGHWRAAGAHKISFLFPCLPGARATHARRMQRRRRKKTTAAGGTVARRTAAAQPPTTHESWQRLPPPPFVQVPEVKHNLGVAGGNIVLFQQRGATSPSGAVAATGGPSSS